MSQQRPPSYYGQPQPPLVPGPQRRLPIDLWVILLAAAAGLALLTCLVAVTLVILRVALPEPPLPVTPRPVGNATTAPIQATAAPTFDSANAGQFFNPYVSAGLDNMQAIQIDLRDPASGNYVQAAQITGDALAKFVEAFNVSVKTTAPDLNCVNHVRFSIKRADSSVITISACLKGAVILRGNIPDLNGADAPMYPGFTDTLAPYLSEELRGLLNF